MAEPWHIRARLGAGAAAALGATAFAVFAGGGYSGSARTAFGLIAIAGAGAALRFWREPLGPLLREPLVLVLLALAALGALSALWTVGLRDETLEWALVTTGYAGVLVLSAAVARRRGGVALLAAGLAALAALTAALGLVGAAVGDDAFAQRIAGAWRPGGPFEYPPALALAQVGALPALVAGMLHRSGAVAGAAGIGMVLAGGVLATSVSRTALALAVLVAGLMVASPPAGMPRSVVMRALGVAAGGGIAIATAGDGSEVARLTVLAVLLLGAVPLWLAVRGDRGPSAPRPARLRRPRVAAAVVAGLAATAGALAFGAAAGQGDGRDSGFLHGRTDTWAAALQAFADRPLAGAGADAFLAASARHQDGGSIAFAHNLPLELAAELGVAGLVLALALYAAALRLVWRARNARAAWLLGPAVVAFMASNLLDWTWHLAGSGAAWAVAAGALAGVADRTPN